MLRCLDPADYQEKHCRFHQLAGLPLLSNHVLLWSQGLITIPQTLHCLLSGRPSLAMLGALHLRFQKSLHHPNQSHRVHFRYHEIPYCLQKTQRWFRRLQLHHRQRLDEHLVQLSRFVHSGYDRLPLGHHHLLKSFPLLRPMHQLNSPRQ